mgnify:CR=1 FL=1
MSEAAEVVAADMAEAPPPPGKAADALRTIAEVAAELDLPQHVLRFWETRFPELKPVKRAGGRRYYRTRDIDLLRRIKALLHAQGFTIKGARKALRGADLPPPEVTEDGPDEAPKARIDRARRRALEDLLADLEVARGVLAKV